jgi:hypothetical protein
MIRSMFKNAVNVRAEDLLAAVGLERRRRAMDHMFTAATYFIAGCIVGGTVAVLLSPTSGRTLRDQLGQRLRTAGERARRTADDVRKRAARERAHYDEVASGATS